MSTVQVELTDGIAVVTISNPAARNSLDDDARRSLLSALRELDQDESIVVIILTGAGGNFCAGGDVRSMPTDPAAIRIRLGEMHDIFRVLATGCTPKVAAVEGTAFGSGMAMALACDVVVAGQDAAFGCTFSRLGLAPDTGLIWTLNRRVGPARARVLTLAPTITPSQAALSMGMIDYVTATGHALDLAKRVAGEIRGAAPLARDRTRELLSAAGEDVETFLALELTVQTDLLASADFEEGRSAFLDRKQPTFRGK